MTKTLVTDGFEDGERPEALEHNYEPHSIVYGATGWTDAVDDATIEVLLKAGVIVLDKVHSGIDWETRVYVSKKGKLK